MEYIFSQKLSAQGQLNTEFDIEEVDFNVMNQETSEPIYLEVRDILHFKNQKASGIDGIMTEILQKVGPGLRRKIHGLIKIVSKYPQIGRWELYAQQIIKGDWNKCDNYRGISHLSCIQEVLSHIISNSLTEYAEKNNW